MLNLLTGRCAALLSLALLLCGTASAAGNGDPLSAWKPAFDPGKAQYTYILSNIAHPGVAGIGVGYRIRDRVWEKSDGRLYVDFRPLGQLGGEKDVLSKLKLGAVHGMLCSSVAAANVADKLGVVNLPFVIDTFAKLDTFRNTPGLWNEFRDAALPQGMLVMDITGYGTYGWATTTPVTTLAEARAINFRIAEAPVNTDIYKAWGLKFTVMPWPDVPQALQTGVINGLDHTPTICNNTKKFDFAKNFTRVDYAQGLFVHLTNRRWFDRLPPDLQKILTETIQEESAKAREETKKEQEEHIAAAKAAGVRFISLPEGEKKRLIELSAPVYDAWAKKIGPEYLQRVQATLGK